MSPAEHTTSVQTQDGCSWRQCFPPSYCSSVLMPKNPLHNVLLNWVHG